MSKIPVYVLLSIVGIISIITGILTMIRFRKRILWSRSPFYLISGICVSAMLVVDLVFLLNYNLPGKAIKIHSYLSGILVSLYIVRILIVLDSYKYSKFKSKQAKIAMFGLLFAFLAAIFTSPVTIITFANPLDPIVYLSGTMIVSYIIVLSICVGVFSTIGKESFKIKQEVISVSVISILGWIIVFTFAGINEQFFVENIEPIYWGLFICSMCVFYFHSALPLALSYKEEEE